MMDKKFAVQKRVETGDRNCWSWCYNKYYDGEGTIRLYSSEKEAKRRKRYLEKEHYKDPHFKEFRVVRVRFNRDYEVDK